MKLLQALLIILFFSCTSETECGLELSKMEREAVSRPSKYYDSYNFQPELIDELKTRIHDKWNLPNGFNLYSTNSTSDSTLITIQGIKNVNDMREICCFIFNSHLENLKEYRLISFESFYTPVFGMKNK